MPEEIQQNLIQDVPVENVTAQDPIKGNAVYKFMKANNLTSLSEGDFVKKYSTPEKAKEIHSFMTTNRLTTLNDNDFYNKYFPAASTITVTDEAGVKKKVPASSNPTLQNLLNFAKSGAKVGKAPSAVNQTKFADKNQILAPKLVVPTNTREAVLANRQENWSSLVDDAAFRAVEKTVNKNNKQGVSYTRDKIQGMVDDYKKKVKSGELIIAEDPATGNNMLAVPDYNPFSSLLSTYNKGNEQKYEDAYVESLTPEEQVRHKDAQRFAAENDDSIPKIPAGIFGNLGGFGGGFVNMIEKPLVYSVALASGAGVPELAALGTTELATAGGLSSVGNTLGFMSDMSNSSYTPTHDKVYYANLVGIENPTQQQKVEAAKKATEAANYSKAIGGVEGLIFGIPFGSLSKTLEPTSRGFIENIVANGKNTLKHAPQMVGTSIAGQIGKGEVGAAYGSGETQSDIIKEGLSTGYETAKFLATLSGLNAVKTAVPYAFTLLTDKSQSPSKSTTAKAKAIVGQFPNEVISNVYGQAEQNGIIQPGKANEILSEIQKYREAEASVPETVTNTDARDAIAGKLEKLDKLDQELKATKVNARKVEIEKEKAQVEKEIDNIYNGDDVLANEKDNAGNPLKERSEIGKAPVLADEAVIMETPKAETKPTEEVKPTEGEIDVNERNKEYPSPGLLVKKFVEKGDNQLLTGEDAAFQDNSIERTISSGIKKGLNKEQIIQMLNANGHVFNAGNDIITITNYVKNRINGTETRPFGEFKKNTRVEAAEVKPTEQNESTVDNAIAADYLLTGGFNTILSTDYLLKGISGVFPKAGKLIDGIRNKYAKELAGKNLVDIKNFINTETYNKIISEIKDSIKQSYGENADIQSIFDEVLQYPTGMPQRIGNNIESRIEALEKVKPTEVKPKEDVSYDYQGDLIKVGKTEAKESKPAEAKAEVEPEVTVEGLINGYKVISGKKESAIGDIRQDANEARAAGKKSFTQETVKDGKKTFTLVDTTTKDDVGRPAYKSASITLPEGTELTIEDVMPRLKNELGIKEEVKPTETKAEAEMVDFLNKSKEKLEKFEEVKPTEVAFAATENAFPISELNKMPKGELHRTEESQNKLKEDISKNGIKEPLILVYYVKDNALRLKEGHHRLDAANKLGLQDVPIKVQVEWDNSIREERDIQGQKLYQPPAPLDIESYKKRNYQPTNIKLSELGFKEKPAQEKVKPTEVKEEVKPTETKAEAEMVDFLNKSVEELEKRQSKIEDAKSGTSEYKEYLDIDNELQNREWRSVFDTTLDNVSNVVDGIMKKEKEMPNGFGSYMEPKDARLTKEVADKYSKENVSKLSDSEIIKDFKDAMFGKPMDWYSDGLKLRESIKQAKERGIDTFEELSKEFVKDGYNKQDAIDMAKRKLEPLLKSIEPVKELKKIEEVKPTEYTKDDLKSAEAKFATAKDKFDKAKAKLEASQVTQKGLFGGEQKGMFAAKAEEAKSTLDPLRKAAKEAKTELDNIKNRIKVQEEAQQELKPVEKVVFKSSQGHTVELKNGELVVKDKKGEALSGRASRKAIEEYAENFDYSKGEKAPEVPSEITNSRDAAKYVVEESNNPIEIAEIYASEDLLPKESDPKFQAIAEYGLGRIKTSSYKNLGDPNKIEKSMYLKIFSEERGTPIDVLAKSISDKYEGLNVEPKDIVDYIEKYSKGDKSALEFKESDIALQAADKFNKLTGLELNSDLANKVIDNKLGKANKDQLDIIKQDYETAKQLEDAYWAEYEKTDGFTKESNISEIDKSKAAKEPEKKLEEAYKDLTNIEKRQIINSKFEELLKELKIEKICPTD